MPQSDHPHAALDLRAIPCESCKRQAAELGLTVHVNPIPTLEQERALTERWEVAARESGIVRQMEIVIADLVRQLGGEATVDDWAMVERRRLWIQRDAAHSGVRIAVDQPASTQTQVTSDEQPSQPDAQDHGA